MIESFGNRLAENLFFDRQSRETRSFPPELKRQSARRKLLYLHDASELGDLQVPPGNRLETLKGEWRGFHSIRINDQWRVVFRWHGRPRGRCPCAGLSLRVGIEAEVLDYGKEEYGTTGKSVSSGRNSPGRNSCNQERLRRRRLLGRSDGRKLGSTNLFVVSEA